MSKIIIGNELLITDSALPRDNLLGNRISFDTDLLLATRLLITADSGAGKSWVGRVLFEQSFGKVQQIIIDPEGEYASLREKFPFVLAARKGGDTPADVRSAALLAHRLLKLRASAICDLYELKPDERHTWVRNFCEALIEAPKELRTPLILAIDEMHMFAPEKGQGESEAKAQVIDVGTRGRKRAICLVGMTQRLAMLDKSVTSQLQNRLVGAQFEEVNVAAAFKLFGIPPGAAQREFRGQLQLLDPGQFFAFGRAISRHRILVKVGDVQTTHPKAFQKHTAPLPPTPEKIKELLPQLADLPKEAEDKLRTESGYKREIARLLREMKQRPAPAPAEPKVVRERIEVWKTPKWATELFKTVKAFADKQRSAIELLQDNLTEASALKDSVTETSNVVPKYIPEFKHKTYGFDITIDRKTGTGSISGPNVKDVPKYVPKESASSNGHTKLPVGERAVLIAAAQFNGVDKSKLITLTGYARRSRDAYVHRLAQRGYVSVQGHTVSPTESGIAALGSDYAPLPTGDDLWQYWQSNLPEGELKLLHMLMDAGRGEYVTKDSLMSGTSYAQRSVNAYLYRLAAKRLVEIDRGQARACEDLFD